MSETNPTQAQGQSPRQARAEQILDAATELFERFGYKRVTIDDIAMQTRIARGTIYQFWKTREALYDAVLAREFSEVFAEILAAIRQDPREALLHRLMRVEYLSVMRRPVLHALFTADLTMLGKFATEGIDKAFDAHSEMIFRDYLQLLVEHRLLRKDISLANLEYAISATATGFFLAEQFINSDQPQLDLEGQADLLAATVQSAFEGEGFPGTIQAIAPTVIELFSKILDGHQSHLSLAYE